jgi:hypothetical protein
MTNLMQKAQQLSASKSRGGNVFSQTTPALQSNTSNVLKSIHNRNAVELQKKQQATLQAQESEKLRLQTEVLNTANKGLNTNVPVQNTNKGLGKPIQQSKPIITDTTQNTKYTVVVDGNFIKYDIPVLYHGTQTPNRIVTHRTAGHGFNTPNDPRALKQGLAAHYTVTQDGKIYQIGDPTKKLWHAGSKGNNGGIGIEATGVYKNGAWEPLTDAQKQSLVTLKQKLYNQYHITQPAVPHYKLANKTGTEGQYIADLFNNSI